MLESAAVETHAEVKRRAIIRESVFECLELTGQETSGVNLRKG